MNCKEINSMDMIEVLKGLGYRPVSRSKDDYMYVAKYRDDTKPSLCVNSVKNYWYDFGLGKGGKLVDLLMLILQTNEVSEVINHCNKHLHLFSFSQQDNGPQKEKNKAYEITKIIKPVASASLIDYLTQRGISRSTWNDHLHQIHYVNQHGNFYALGFKNDQGGFEIRNKYMRSPICLGPKSITTIPGTDTTILFEGYFDYLSFKELKLYKGQSVIVLNTTAKVKAGIEKINRDFSNAKIECYLDNDRAGNDTTQKIMEAYPFSKDKRWIYSGFKDLNELLVSKVARERNLANAPEASHVLVRPKRLLP